MDNILSIDRLYPKLYLVPETYSVPTPFHNQEILVIAKQEDLNNDADFLNKILKAIDKAGDDHTFILGYKDSEQLDLTQWTRSHFSHVIIFGINPQKLGLNTKLSGYNFYKTETYSIMLGHPLSMISGQQKYKKALWTCLQTEFVKN